MTTETIRRELNALLHHVQNSYPAIGHAAGCRPGDWLVTPHAWRNGKLVDLDDAELIERVEVVRRSGIGSESPPPGTGFMATAQWTRMVELEHALRALATRGESNE